MSAEKHLWISGWGIPPKWLETRLNENFPNFSHTVLPPTPDVLDSVTPTGFSKIGGYSLGAFLLLKNAPKISLPALLLAPFFAWPAEEKLGGKIRRTQLLFLSRWLRKSPLEALADFYLRANLPIPPPSSLPYPLPDLEWGLKVLTNERVPVSIPQNWTGIIGDSDPLLDGKKLTEIAPRLKLLSGAGHDPASLLQFL